MERGAENLSFPLPDEKYSTPRGLDCSRKPASRLPIMTAVSHRRAMANKNKIFGG
jgi:hypothetical protein